MCGIAGFVDTSASTSRDELQGQTLRMAAALAHRGPDDAGVWVDERCGVGLGHRRLSIIDLSPLGHQPMISATGRFVITYNGEIYNYRDLRAELQRSGATFRGHSDTEVMLAAFETWGFEASLKRFNGMFAIVLWDRAERRLSLARDRFGEKPLYYALFGKRLLFGSELKALRANPAFVGDIDRGSLAQYLRFACVPAPRTIFANVWKLLPGTATSFAPEAGKLDAPKRYWSMIDVALGGARDPFRGTDDEAVDGLDQVLRESIRARMVADVPLGAFLSGGIDSSTVVALMQAQSERPVRTFTIGFEETTHDEAKAAKAVAAHLGTDHSELYVTPDEAQAVIPRLPVLYDEPFADSSQIPTFLVAQLARRDVTVALSGDGGDELFGGYNRYLWAESIWRSISRLPPGWRRAAGSVLDRARPDAIDAHAERLAPWLPRTLRHRMTGDKTRKLAEALRATDEEALFLSLLSTWTDPASLVGVDEPRLPILAEERPRLAHLTERMMVTDAVLYLPDDVLAKVDRATMAVSLEGRVPMLDPAVAAFACRLPRRLKIRGRRGKWALRELLARYVPRVLFERPKMGFAVPIGAWLRGPLRAWAEAELDESRLRRGGYLDAVPIRRAWREHLEGGKDVQGRLWTVLMFQAWHERWTEGNAALARVAPAAVATPAQAP